MITYGVIAWLVPKTYSTTLDTSLDSAVNSFLVEVERVTPLESGKLFDEFVLNQNGVLIQLFDSSNNEIELPSQSSSAFPVFVTSGVAIESDDPAAYRATHSYIFTFADSDEVYTLTVAGSAQEVDLLKDTLYFRRNFRRPALCSSSGCCIGFYCLFSLCDQTCSAYQ